MLGPVGRRVSTLARCRASLHEGCSFGVLRRDTWIASAYGLRYDLSCVILVTGISLRSFGQAPPISLCFCLFAFMD